MVNDCQPRRPLAELFMVMATQTRIEQEGNLSTARAQVAPLHVEAFVNYPAQTAERLMLDRMTSPIKPSVQPVFRRSRSCQLAIWCASLYG